MSWNKCKKTEDGSLLHVQEIILLFFSVFKVSEDPSHSLCMRTDIPCHCAFFTL
ncbi:hypothetical protein QSI_0350 [Clostridioides difficile P28]|nr:hypothetical protein QSI_0350 [Clostridioides difficile P28]